MEITGIIILINPLVTGESKNGIWKKQDFVIETDAQYPKKICFTLWGDKISKLESVVGDKVTISFDIESKEYNGKWFTEAKAWLIKKESKLVDEKESEVYPFSDVAAIPINDIPPMDDLPFQFQSQ